MHALTTVVLAAAVALTACKGKDDAHRDLPPATNWQDPAAPNLGGPPIPGHAGVGMGMGSPHGSSGMPDDDVHAGLGGGGEISGQSPDPERPIDPGKFLRGEIVAADAVSDAVPASTVIFLSVKMVDPKTKEPMGAPLAVHRIDATSWPVPFELTERNQMRQGDAPFAGEVVVMAWTDQDGEGQTRQPGDVVGQLITTIPGDALRLVLDSVIP